MGAPSRMGSAETRQPRSCWEARRLRCGLAQSSVAERVRIHPTLLALIERGAIGPRADVATRLGVALKAAKRGPKALHRALDCLLALQDDYLPDLLPPNSPAWAHLRELRRELEKLVP